MISGIRIDSGILSDKLSCSKADILSDILSDTLFGIFSGIVSGILSGMHSEILFGKNPNTLSGKCSRLSVPSPCNS